MIISASRRTDIPAAYSEWFLNRLDEGFILQRLPNQPRQLTRISLDRDVVDCIVFWTKNFGPLLPNLRKLKAYPFYVQHTLTAYDNAIEGRIPSKNEILKTFKALSSEVGADAVIWRYDPILLSEEISVEYHKKWFEVLAQKLAGHTHRCVVSFLDPYKKIANEMAKQNFRAPSTAEELEILVHFAEVGASWGIQIETCAERGDFSRIGINPTKCIDDKLVAAICKTPFAAAKDRSQRAACGCIPSIDIGVYGTCPGGCSYCYATSAHDAAAQTHREHDPKSPLLCEKIRGGEQIVDRKMFSHFKYLAPDLLSSNP